MRVRDFAPAARTTPWVKGDGVSEEEHIVLEDGGHLHLIRRWLSPTESKTLFSALKAELPWRQETFKMGG